MAQPSVLAGADHARCTVVNPVSGVGALAAPAAGVSGQGSSPKASNAARRPCRGVGAARLGAGAPGGRDARRAATARPQNGIEVIFGVTTVFQLIGYALLDFDDAYQITSLGTFTAGTRIWSSGTSVPCWTNWLVAMLTCRLSGRSFGTFC